eukprot:86180_1
MRAGWYLMVAIILLCSVTSIILTCIQILSTGCYKHHSDHHNLTRKERTLLYGIYLGGVLCSSQCFALRMSKYFPSWYCSYGIGICTALYAAEKSFLYGFFLERSKSLQRLLDHTFIPPILATYVLPGYIMSYFVVFSVLSILEYRGRIDEPISDGALSPCTAWRYYHWMFTVGAIVDGVTCSILLFLFIYPLYDAIKKTRGSTQHYRRLLKATKINALCSSVCFLSSIASMIILGAHWARIDYVMLFTNIDMLINSIFGFMIPDSNRKYVSYLRQSCKRVDANASQSIFESATTGRDLSTIYEIESKYERSSFNENLSKIQIQKQLESMTHDTTDTLGEVAVLRDNKSLTFSDIAGGDGTP